MENQLAPYAVSEENSKGRRIHQPRHPYRTGFIRDRDRIIHCSAFRRLEGKTQVFTPGRDDHYRTRLTHSIEVAQIGRTISRALNLNEALTEAICLAHDLGHSPFGHTGEQVLNQIFAETGGFEHNYQSLRVVDLLEHPYPEVAGLNLMYETRLGLARHSTTYDNPRPGEFPERNCSLEGQVADLADRIAYNCHDLEDAMRAEMLDEELLKNLPLFIQACDRIQAHKIADESTRHTRIAKAVIDSLVSDAIETSQHSISLAGISGVDQVYNMDRRLIELSEQASANLLEFERFLLQNVYRHRALEEINAKVAGWLQKLVDLFISRPQLMPAYYRRLAEAQSLDRAVCDYIAGMTDRFCLKILEEY